MSGTDRKILNSLRAYAKSFDFEVGVCECYPELMVWTGSGRVFAIGLIDEEQEQYQEATNKQFRERGRDLYPINSLVEGRYIIFGEHLIEEMHDV